MMMMMVVTAVTVNRQRQGQQVPIQGQVLRLPAPGDLVARNFSKVEHCPSVQTSTMSKCSKKVCGPICRNLHVYEVQLFKGPFQIAFFPEFMVPFHYRYNYLH